MHQTKDRPIPAVDYLVNITRTSPYTARRWLRESEIELIAGQPKLQAYPKDLDQLIADRSRKRRAGGQRND